MKHSSQRAVARMVTRKFLDWTHAALPQVVANLQAKYTSQKTCDLSNVLVVFPGQQAGRRFLELLTTLTHGKLMPPRIMTVGQLPEELYEPKLAFASQLTQRLAWAEALKQLPDEDLQTVIAQPPSERDVDAWLSLGELLSKQHRELAADLLSFDDVASRGASLSEFNEAGRWGILSQVQKNYLALLDEYEVWDQQSARLVAIERKECRTDKQIILVGTVDLNKTMRSMLDQVSEHVTTYIHAPPELKPKQLNALFDEYGCLVASAWADREIEIGFEQVEIVDGPLEQAEAVVQKIANYNGQFAIDDITVCLPDDRIAPHVQRTLKQFDISSRWVIAKHLYESKPYRLLEAVSAYLESFSTTDFANLIRHPDMSAWIDQQGLPAEWLSSWDEYVITHLQRNTDEILGKSQSSKICKQLKQMIHNALKPFAGDSRPLSDWASPFTDFLLTIYGDIEFQKDNEADVVLLSACKKLHEACVEHTSLPDALVPVVTAPQAIHLTLEQVQGEIITPISNEAAIQLYGWLDMALEDAGAAIITSFNESYVPSSVNHDLFLPNRLRAHLEIEDNSRRYARDAYALCVLLHSRKELHLIVAKRDVQSEPMIPSRLLFATDAKTIALRVQKFFGEHQESRTALVTPLQAGEVSQFSIPKPVAQLFKKQSFSVTEFSMYLASPYRYYLGRVLRLGELSDAVDELDPLAFGNLIHEVLNVFGESPLANSTDQAAVTEFLLETLQKTVFNEYGSDPLFPVIVQVEQVRARLKAFAQWQVGWRLEGWEMKFCEVGGQEGTPFQIDEKTTIYIKGRIDRIDYNADLDQWAVLDYKTGDAGKEPNQVHRTKGMWVDLQLPLYRHLSKKYGVTGNVLLGYVVIPRDTNQIGPKFANWTDEELLEADDVVRDTALRILNEEFWIELDKPFPYPSGFDPICQTGVFGSEALV